MNHRLNKKVGIGLMMLALLAQNVLLGVATASAAGWGSNVQSKFLTINGNSVSWALTGAMPTKFEDDAHGFNYWSAGKLDFTITHTVKGLPAGTYTMRVKVYGGDDPLPGSVMFAHSGGHDYQTAISYTGSAWDSASNSPAWAELILENVLVGQEGTVDIGFHVAAANHWGTLSSVTLKKAEAHSEVVRIQMSPNSVNLRPGVHQQLKATVFPLNAANANVIYSSSDEKIASVDSTGLVAARSDGEVTISAASAENRQIKASTRILVSAVWQKHSTEQVQVEPVKQLQDGKRSDFIMGADLSSIYEIEKSGRKYYDQNGVEKPAMQILKENGVNWVRFRLWNDPKDASGHWYGAGNTDKTRVIAMAQQAKALGLKVLVDFHYSDFWADPGNQIIPKAWRSMTADQLKQAVYDYTYEVITDLQAAKASPDMVQIGNEINSGLLWPLGDTPAKAKPFIAKGIEAVRTAQGSKDKIKIMIHRANPENGADAFKDYYKNYDDLDYDVIGISYYPFWHGTLANLKDVMNSLATAYGREIAVAETSYAFTLDDDPKDNIGNVFGEDRQKIGGYVASIAGQATAIRNVIAAVAEVPNNKGAGVFYWEPAWLPGIDTGWATVAGAAHSNSVLKHDEGSSWKNQGLFNYFGEALPSVSLFQKVRQPDSEYTPAAIQSVDDLSITTSQDINVPLPDAVPVLYSDGAYRSTEVKQWTPAQYDYHVPGRYSAQGSLGGGTVRVAIIVTGKNYVQNPGIEDSDMSMWSLTGCDRSSEGHYSGTYAIHFWNQNLVKVKQTITGLPDGTYELTMVSRIGGDPTGKAYLYAKGRKESSTPLNNKGWFGWEKNVIHNIEVSGGTLEIGAVVEKCLNTGGDFDDWALMKN